VRVVGRARPPCRPRAAGRRGRDRGPGGVLLCAARLHGRAPVEGDLDLGDVVGLQRHEPAVGPALGSVSSQALRPPGTPWLVAEADKLPVARVGRLAERHRPDRLARGVLQGSICGVLEARGARAARGSTVTNRSPWTRSGRWIKRASCRSRRAGRSSSVAPRAVGLAGRAPPLALVGDQRARRPWRPCRVKERLAHPRVGRGPPRAGSPSRPGREDGEEGDGDDEGLEFHRGAARGAPPSACACGRTRAEAADEERGGEEVDGEQPVLQGVDALAQREADLAALAAQLGLLLLEVLDRLGRLGRGDQPAALGLLALELGELGLDLVELGLERRSASPRYFSAGRGLHPRTTVKGRTRVALAADRDQVLRAGEEVERVGGEGARLSLSGSAAVWPRKLNLRTL
jgi:hypothetical protein